MDSKLTPMMKQYLDTKKKYPHEILFFRLGDFYEMFFEDAHTASKILDIALTSRQNDVPMCGIPYHAAESYIARLIKAGHRVAICEQMENTPSSGTIVKREVTRVITPGTIIESNLLQSDENNYLASIVLESDSIGMAFVDVSTGDFSILSTGKTLDRFRSEFMRYKPREVIVKESVEQEDEAFTVYLKSALIPINRLNEWLYDRDYMTDIIKETYKIAGLKGLGLNDTAEILAAGSILEYLKDTHKKTFDHLKLPQRIVSGKYMLLDDATISNLELVSNQQEGTRERTLYSVLNRTHTAMGKRALLRNILQPLLLKEEIENRLDIVQYFYEYQDLQKRIHSVLDEIYDLERLLSRFSMGKIFPRDYLSVTQSVKASVELKQILHEQPYDRCKQIADRIPDLGKLAESIENTIEENPALTPEQGRVIKEGHSDELDRLYVLKTDAKSWILNYQEEEKARLGIPTLKVRYNKVLGYYIEVSKGQASKAPDNYYRKQTLVGSERYTTEKLQKFESDILSSSEEIVKIENTELERLKDSILSNGSDIRKIAETVGEIDFYCSLSIAALENNYARPVFNETGESSIKEGRHPMVEKYYTREVFVPNDLHLDPAGNFITIITGPNMSGKSTYIRMAAIIQLMAQVGSFVPAEQVNLSMVDRIFTRIGAGDNIARGESTFLVEMNETAFILNNATQSSLIIMDEVGRGTSTFDGISIAWAVVEYILRYIKAKTLFATHYHEMTSLSDKNGIVNYNVLVKENLGGVDFLHKVVPGTADKSYGIHVAKLAGIPREVTGRAAKILERMEKQKNKPSGGSGGDSEDSQEQLEIFNAVNHRIIQAIKNIDVNGTTPMQAINEINRLKKMIEKG